MAGVTNPPRPEPSDPPCPRPSGCCCAWTLNRDFRDWHKGDDHAQCPVHS